jgi:hypothetical protein
VHAFPSSQVVPAADWTTVHWEVPLHVRFVQPVLLHVTPVPPPQVPLPSHFSPYVQALPSSHAVPAANMFVATHTPLPSQASFVVHELWSSHGVPAARAVYTQALGVPEALVHGPL